MVRAARQLSLATFLGDFVLIRLFHDTILPKPAGTGAGV